jgi:hypothetical protein
VSIEKRREKAKMRKRSWRIKWSEYTDLNIFYMDIIISLASGIIGG